MSTADYGPPTSYLVLEPGTPVHASDGARLGGVKRVLAVPDDDVFDGLILDTPDGDRFVDADNVDRIHERAVVLRLSQADAEHLPDPTASPAAMDVTADDFTPNSLGDRLRRAWDLISGRY